MKRYVSEEKKQIPVIGNYDVVVIGGGVAGVAAALAASRNGSKVCIVEKENGLGGLATLGLVAIYLPLCDGMGNQVIGGIGEELLRLSIADGPGEIPDCWINDDNIEERKKRRFRLMFNPSTFMIGMEELVLQNNIEIMYDSRFCTTIVEEGFIKAVIIENKDGRCAVMAKVTIDASGDADVCYMSGEKTVSVDTNKRSGWFYSYNGKNVDLHKLSDPLYGPTPEGSRTYSGDNWKDVTALNIDGRKMIMNKVRSLRKVEGNEVLYPLMIPAIPLFRMTRRLRGIYEIDEKDDKICFEDRIGMTGDWRKNGPLFHIPFRCLIGEKIGNLLAVGRCISATDSAWDIIRAIPTCAVTGQAAGTAAAMEASKDGEVSSIDIKKLQDRLKQQGVMFK